jgi:hypothetical protein
MPGAAVEHATATANLGTFLHTTLIGKFRVWAELLTGVGAAPVPQRLAGRADADPVDLRLGTRDPHDRRDRRHQPGGGRALTLTMSGF